MYCFFDICLPSKLVGKFGFEVSKICKICFSRRVVFDAISTSWRMRFVAWCCLLVASPLLPFSLHCVVRGASLLAACLRFTIGSWTVLQAVLFFILYSNASVFWIELVGRQFGVLLSVSVYLCTCGPTLVWSSKLTSFDTEPEKFFSLGWRQLLSFLLFRSVVPRGAARISECLLECLWGHYVGEFDNDWSLEKRWS